MGARKEQEDEDVVLGDQLLDVEELELERDRVQERRLLDSLQGDSRHNTRMQDVKDHLQDQPQQYRVVLTVDSWVTHKTGVGPKILHYAQRQTRWLDGAVVGKETEEEDAAIGVSAESGRLWWQTPRLRVATSSWSHPKSAQCSNLRVRKTKWAPFCPA